MKIIVPFREENLTNIQKKISSVQNKIDIAEIWLDSLNYGNLEDLNKNLANFFTSFSQQNIKFLGVCKSPKYNGKFVGNEKEQLSVLQSFLASGGDYIDLDISMISNVEKVKTLEKNLWLSFHDFSVTPTNLEKICEKIFEIPAFLYKFAVTANTEKELKLFQNFAKNCPKNKKYLFSVMGKMGKKGRENFREKLYQYGEFVAFDKNSYTADGQFCLNNF